MNKKYEELKRQEYKKKEIMSLMEFDNSQRSINGYSAFIIRSCIDPNSDIGKRGMVHIAVPFKLGWTRGLKEELYHAFLFDYALGRIKEGLI